MAQTLFDPENIDDFGPENGRQGPKATPELFNAVWQVINDNIGNIATALAAARSNELTAFLSTAESNDFNPSAFPAGNREPIVDLETLVRFLRRRTAIAGDMAEPREFAFVDAQLLRALMTDTVENNSNLIATSKSVHWAMQQTVSPTAPGVVSPDWYHPLRALIGNPVTERTVSGFVDLGDGQAINQVYVEGYGTKDLGDAIGIRLWVRRDGTGSYSVNVETRKNIDDGFDNDTVRVDDYVFQITPVNNGTVSAPILVDITTTTGWYLYFRLSTPAEVLVDSAFYITATPSGNIIY